MSSDDTDLPSPPPGGWTSETLYAHLAPYRPEPVSLLGIGQDAELRVFWTLLPHPPDEASRRLIANILRKVADQLDGGGFRSITPQAKDQG